jgi:hypothetical protein
MDPCVGGPKPLQRLLDFGGALTGPRLLRLSLPPAPARLPRPGREAGGACGLCGPAGDRARAGVAQCRRGGPGSPTRPLHTILENHSGGTGPPHTILQMPAPSKPEFHIHRRLRKITQPRGMGKKQVLFQGRGKKL